MGRCVLCRKKVERGIGAFFQAPQDAGRCALWSRVCQRQFKKRDVVCADHFASTDYVLGQKRATLLPKAVPIPPSPTSTYIPPPSVTSIPQPSFTCSPQPCSTYILPLQEEFLSDEQQG